MNGTKLISIGAVIVVLVAVIFFLMGKSGQTPISDFTEGHCTVDTDCALVQDGWCKTVSAIKKNQAAVWKAQNIKQVEIARQNRQTCELMPEEFQVMENFSAVCKETSCTAKFTGTLAR